MATIWQPDGSPQEVKRYRPGEVFGEKALMESKPRAASIVSTTEVVVLQLSRAEFEMELGFSMSQFWATQYNSNPRKLLADFYRKGDANSSKGSLPPLAHGKLPDPDGSSSAAKTNQSDVDATQSDAGRLPQHPIAARPAGLPCTAPAHVRAL